MISLTMSVCKCDKESSQREKGGKEEEMTRDRRRSSDDQRYQVYYFLTCKTARTAAIDIRDLHIKESEIT